MKAIHITTKHRRMIGTDHSRAWTTHTIIDRRGNVLYETNAHVKEVNLWARANGVEITNRFTELDNRQTRKSYGQKKAAV